jgi:hypothetical protein
VDGLEGSGKGQAGHSMGTGHGAVFRPTGNSLFLGAGALKMEALFPRQTSRYTVQYGERSPSTAHSHRLECLIPQGEISQLVQLVLESALRY